MRGTSTASMTVEEMVDILSGTGTEEWNAALAKHLQIVQNMLALDAWTKAVDPYIRALQGEAVLKLLDAKTPPEGINYLRGYAAALRLILCLPKSVDYQIEAQATRGEKGVPKGSAGY